MKGKRSVFDFADIENAYDISRRRHSTNRICCHGQCQYVASHLQKSLPKAAPDNMRAGTVLQ